MAPLAPTSDAPVGTLRSWPLTGALLVASAVLAAVGAVLLGAVFGWPDVLDEPGAVALPEFSRAEESIRFGFYLQLVSSLLLVPAAVGVQVALTRGSAAARVFTGFGVAGALFQLLGWVRWPIVVPGLAERYADPSATEAERAATASAVAWVLLIVPEPFVPALAGDGVVRRRVHRLHRLVRVGRRARRAPRAAPRRPGPPLALIHPPLDPPEDRRGRSRRRRRSPRGHRVRRPRRAGPPRHPGARRRPLDPRRPGARRGAGPRRRRHDADGVAAAVRGATTVYHCAQPAYRAGRRSSRR